MLSKIADRSNVRGLVFTYSGGFRIVPSKHAIETLEGILPKESDALDATGNMLKTLNDMFYDYDDRKAAEATLGDEYWE